MGPHSAIQSEVGGYVLAKGSQDAHCSAEQPKEDEKGEGTEVSENQCHSQGQGEGHGHQMGSGEQA